jgi:hypothetical protein
MDDAGPKSLITVSDHHPFRSAGWMIASVAARMASIESAITSLGPLAVIDHGQALSLNANPLVDALRSEVRLLQGDIEPAKARLTLIQNKLIDLLDVLDPKCFRFKPGDRTKV